ncbi:MAG: LutB/LldF family L-lactate oxidation iron-sulfur protein [Geminicoccaceae bacterium]|nr:LutB/LldF family L-lactate oxidation iron-sulfur protein [Geminicoccaceae bacterium]MCS7267475.1 LutB/LldF family L-lactate oxidation iron-sulfur protein [Geminicoccaceae bacterium]MCX7629156.1 LutB/LldF family L-lactate oxidation iron-sulfur protein [Geminicoccaceae bacterium]MDW8123679.1 LutB/LldF family L-lactate oxidation iron-sulfur protein [Geminicoccaceae bacterium]MDW8342415.1 LutB/LldF family L-lactate oxidation iron-sulfur protein [Geminicoccaceae bacterium]
MEPTSLAFRERATRALADPVLSTALARLETGWQAARARAAADLPEFEALRDAAVAIRDHALAHLDFYLEAFERRFTERGGVVHWARDAAEARAIVLELCRAARARTVTKSKSMVAEEIGLNAFLEAHGLRVIETDLGEYIVQLAGEVPSHLVGPAVHMTRERIAELFAKAHGGPPKQDSAALVAEARRVLRQRYLEADVGITGANFLIAETGSIVTVTNEGNAELTQGLPKLHIAITGIEKVVPTVEDAFVLLRLLARSATGQEFSAYTTFLTGPKRPDERDGPEAMHLVLLDNGRTRMLGGPMRAMLRCIRCGACMNHCPVYLAAGGHAYGWVYPGPMGSVLTPHFVGIEKSWPLPNASTFCGRCEEVCPVRIPLPGLMRLWREEAHRRGLAPPAARFGLALWAFFARRPPLYRFATRIAVALLGAFGRRRGRFARLPFARGWTESRDFPAPEGSTFTAQWRARRGTGR